MTDDDRDEERRRQRLIERRRQHRIEVAFWRQSQHPYDDSTGRRLVAEFVSALNEITGILELLNDPADLPEADQKALSGRWRVLRITMPPYYTIERFFTEQQRAEVAALHARVDALLADDDDDAPGDPILA
jgi:hypothetical protein